MSDGRELVASLQNAAADGQAPDLIVTDVRMPGISGLHALAEARRLLPSLPVIVITAFGDAMTHARAAQLGAASVFDKPFDLRSLLRRVQELIEAPA